MLWLGGGVGQGGVALQAVTVTTKALVNNTALYSQPKVPTNRQQNCLMVVSRDELGSSHAKFSCSRRC